MSVIHIAGTKGKARALSSVRRLHRPQPELSWPTPQGSTCAFTERILRSCGRRTGMFTSPHLMDVRERIQINGCVALGCLSVHMSTYPLCRVPVDKDVFVRHFWHCYDVLVVRAASSL